MAGQPKPAFYIVLFLVVAGLVGFGIYRTMAPTEPVKPPGPHAGPLKPPVVEPGNQVNPNGDPTKIDMAQLSGAAEAHDTQGVTTVKEYKFRPAERLPPVKGTADYKLENNTVRFALNVWAGWGPVILANEGSKPEKIWKTADGEEFKVELVLIDSPVAMRDSYAAGNVQIGWATLDMMPLFMQGFVKADGSPVDSRSMPRVYQQIDWSNGGDGIVSRDNIKTIADLRGKKLVLAQNSPSHYFALNMLVAGGVQPSEVEMIFTEDAFQAAAAFDAQRDIAAAVSWAPDIYKLAETKGNRMLVNTQTANKLIADVWFARADFAKDHPGMIEALVRGIFDGMESLKKQEQKLKCAELMSKFYNIPADDTLAMFQDAHNTNWAENYQFFLNQNNPANFERIWSQAYYLYRRISSITHRPVPFDQVMDFSIIEKLGKEPKYASQKNEYVVQLAPKTIGEIKAEQDEILTNTIIIHFYPNSWEIEKKVTKTENGKTVEELYDPNIKFVLEEVAKLAGQFGAAHIIIEGHTDSSMREKGVPASLVKELSSNRAAAVKEALLKKYNTLDPNQFTTTGIGWDKPADGGDADNHAKNRRVEIKVYSAEKQ